jgi:hypothetical protein
MRYFTTALQTEYKSKGIIVQCVYPGYVATAMTGLKPRWWSPDPLDYTRAASATIGILQHTYGYIPHAIQGYVLEVLWSLFPSRLIQNLMMSFEILTSFCLRLLGLTDLTYTTAVVPAGIILIILGSSLILTSLIYLVIQVYVYWRKKRSDHPNLSKAILVKIASCCLMAVSVWSYYFGGNLNHFIDDYGEAIGCNDTSAESMHRLF